MGIIKKKIFHTRDVLFKITREVINSWTGVTATGMREAALSTVARVN